MIIKNDGNATPTVVHTKLPVFLLSIPIYVEILMAKGPGVLSLTAIKSTNSRDVIHPLV